MLIVVLRCFRKILEGLLTSESNQLMGYIILSYYIVLYVYIYFLLEKQNQSIRGNGRKQYQDSPNPKKRANGIHSQPAKQQNPLVVRVNNAHASRQFMLSRMGQGHCQGIFWIALLTGFLCTCVCAGHPLRNLCLRSMIDLACWFSCASDLYFFMWVFVYLLVYDFSMNSYWSVVDSQSCVSLRWRSGSVLRMSALNSVSV